MPELPILTRKNLPTTPEELQKFIQVGESLVAFYEKWLYFQKITNTKEGREFHQKILAEGQEIGETTLWALARLGELLENQPGKEPVLSDGSQPGTIRRGRYRGSKSLLRPKGLTKKFAFETRTIFRHKSLIPTIVAEAKKTENIPTRNDLLAWIKNFSYYVNPIESPVTPEGLFDVIVVDPPWPYGTLYDARSRRVGAPYFHREMSIEEIKAIKLPAADNCILWLWTTHRFMRDAFPILDFWGFKEVAILTWVKDKIGIGRWLRSKSEFCIMAIKGCPKIKLTNQTTVLEGKAREHSRKPEEFYQLIESLCVGRKLDYFSREQREGWAQYGDEITKFKEEN